MGDVRLGKIGQIGMPVLDVQRATAFYRDILRMMYSHHRGDGYLRPVDGILEGH